MGATYFVAQHFKETQVPRARPGEIVVACWNIDPDPIRPRQAELRRALTALRADVIALEEVKSYSELQGLLADLVKDGLDYKVTEPDIRARQNIVLLTRPGINVERAEPIPGSDDDNPGMRKAIDCKLRVNGMVFRVIAVHNKSKRDGDNTDIRTAQCEAIRQWIDTHEPQLGLCLIGDYNMDLENDPDEFKKLDPRSELTFLSKPNKGEVTEFSPGGRTGYYLDGFAVNAFMEQRRLRNSFQIVNLDRIFGRAPGWYRDHVSDHLPLMAIFRVQP